MTAAQLWHAYLATLPTAHPHHHQPTPPSFSFTYNPEDARALALKVREGTKTATCSRYHMGNILDLAGLHIVTDGREQAVCVIEVYEVTVRSYHSIDEAWARDEGDGTLVAEHPLGFL